jgi:hypothetical protein
MPRTLNDLARPALVGVPFALLFGLLVFVLGAKTHFVTAYLAPGFLVGGLLSPAIPSKIVYWVEPNGGPTAFLLLAAICSVAFWSTLFGAVFYRRRSRQGRRDRH